MPALIEADICIIGAGSGGLSVASGAAQLGVKTVLIERAEMGGDCLNFGCIPSKALLAAAKQAERMRGGLPFGIAPVEPEVDFAGVNDHVRAVIDSIRPMDSQERFEELGCLVIRESARFVSPTELVAGEHKVTARRFVIATGSSPATPPILGLDSVPFFTNETIFSNRDLPEQLLIIGGGPIGMEMAQAHRRLGAAVTVIEGLSVLGRDDPEMTAVLIEQQEKEGVIIRQGCPVAEVRGSTGNIEVVLDMGGQHEVIHGTHLLVAAGRAPSIADLDLQAAGIQATPRGISVDSRLRTTNKHVFAIGDVTGGYQFTHVANEHAGIVIRNALFRLPARARTNAIPWVTYTDPELANVGLSEQDARAQYRDITVTRWPLLENDRARAEHKTEGLIKVVTSKRGKILGVCIVCENAGLLIQPWILAINSGLKMRDMASHIAPYPTLGEISKRVAGKYFADDLFAPRTQKLVRFLSRFG